LRPIFFIAARSRVLFASISAINLPRVLTSFNLGKIIDRLAIDARQKMAVLIGAFEPG